MQRVIAELTWFGGSKRPVVLRRKRRMRRLLGFDFVHKSIKGNAGFVCVGDFRITALIALELLMKTTKTTRSTR